MGAKVLGVIPARLGAERLPRKPLRLLGGVPMVVRVAENAVASRALDEIIVATDAEEIAAAVREAGYPVALTGAHHASGTSRVAEVAGRAQYAGVEIVVNVQGDEPFLPHAAIIGSVEQVRAGFDVGTAAVPLQEQDAGAPSLVKVAMGEGGRAVYFSRSPIPYNRAGDATRYWQHLGVYAYRPATLSQWMTLPRSPLEQAERLEQLTPLAHGFTFGVALLDEPALPGIDTEEDLQRAEAYLGAGRP